MHVSEIIERILEISHDEVAPDTKLKQKALRWLNSAYHEMMEVLIPFMPQLEKKIKLTLVDGYAVLPDDLSRVINVVDTNDVKVLYKTIYKDDILNLYINNNSVENVYVNYTTTVNDLEDSVQESSILLPKQFHSLLVWGALVWASIYERGFNNQSELNLFQKKWDEAKREAKLSLASTVNLSTKHQDIF